MLMAFTAKRGEGLISFSRGHFPRRAFGKFTGDEGGSAERAKEAMGKGAKKFAKQVASRAPYS